MSRRPAGAPDASVHAERALRAYTAMRVTFRGLRSMYRDDGRIRLPGSTAHLWPFARAFVATLDLAGMPEPLRAGFDADAAIAEHLTALEDYWDPTPPAAYSSDVVGRRIGGDRYYDDNAWVGLALVELERLRPGAGRLDRCGQLFRFAAQGWDRRPDVPSPGGVFWVEQGRGIGTRNHDRNTVSNAPNAAVGLHLSELGGDPSEPGPHPAGEPTAGPRDMVDWVDGALDASGDGSGTGLFWDKIRGDGTIDRALWSYNQGNMVGANVLRHRAGDGPAHLARAEAIARKALAHFDAHQTEQPAAFHAILWRNLLLLSAETGDETLRRQIDEALTGYAEHVWTEHRDRRDRFVFRGRPTLLDQSAGVQILALRAWDPGEYRRLA